MGLRENSVFHVADGGLGHGWTGQTTDQVKGGVDPGADTGGGKNAAVIVREEWQWCDEETSRKHHQGQTKFTDPKRQKIRLPNP